MQDQKNNFFDIDNTYIKELFFFFGKLKNNQKFGKIGQTFKTKKLNIYIYHDLKKMSIISTI